MEWIAIAVFFIVYIGYIYGIRYTDVVFEGIVLGVIFAVLGGITLGIIKKFGWYPSEFVTYTQIFLFLSVMGGILHLVMEFAGINSYYCSYGSSCKNIRLNN